MLPSGKTGKDHQQEDKKHLLSESEKS